MPNKTPYVFDEYHCIRLYFLTCAYAKTFLSPEVTWFPLFRSRFLQLLVNLARTLSTCKGLCPIDANAWCPNPLTWWGLTCLTQWRFSVSTRYSNTPPPALTAPSTVQPVAAAGPAAARNLPPRAGNHHQSCLFSSLLLKARTRLFTERCLKTTSQSRTDVGTGTTAAECTHPCTPPVLPRAN